MSDLPPDQIARGSAVRSLNSQIAGAISVAALGALVSARMGTSPTPEQAVASYNAAFVACSASLLVGLVLASRLPAVPGASSTRTPCSWPSDACVRGAWVQRVALWRR